MSYFCNTSTIAAITCIWAKKQLILTSKNFQGNCCHGKYFVDFGHHKIGKNYFWKAFSLLYFFKRVWKCPWGTKIGGKCLLSGTGLALLSRFLQDENKAEFSTFSLNFTKKSVDVLNHKTFWVTQKSWRKQPLSKTTGFSAGWRLIFPPVSEHFSAYLGSIGVGKSENRRISSESARLFTFSTRPLYR